MKFYTQQHDFYRGIDLHARSMLLLTQCVADARIERFRLVPDSIAPRWL